MPLFEPLFTALERTEVRYIVVGGLATVLHGHARLTADVDLVVDLIELKRLAGRPKDLEDIERLEEILEIAWEAGALPRHGADDGRGLGRR